MSNQRLSLSRRDRGYTVPERHRFRWGSEVMLTLDAQVHAYERNHPGRPWLGTLYGPTEVTGDQMVAAMDAVGVDGAIWSHRSACIATTPAMLWKSMARIPTGSGWSSRSIRPTPPWLVRSLIGPPPTALSASGSS